MNISDLRDLKLTQDEWNLLPGIAAGHMTYERKQSHVDMLVLAGLVIHLNEGLALTTAGVEAAAEIDMIFDWEEFAHRPDKPVDEDMVYMNGEPISRDEAEKLARPRKGMTVGSLVRHKTTGGVGLITHHHMWDADWGGFRVQFNKPVDNVIEGRVVNQLTQISDRADAFEFAY